MAGEMCHYNTDFLQQRHLFGADLLGDLLGWGGKTSRRDHGPGCAVAINTGPCGGGGKQSPSLKVFQDGIPDLGRKAVKRLKNSEEGEVFPQSKTNKPVKADTVKELCGYGGSAGDERGCPFGAGVTTHPASVF